LTDGICRAWTSLPVLAVATIVGGLTVWAGWTAGLAARRHKPAAA
jgi:hypothetical protein